MQINLLQAKFDKMPMAPLRKYSTQYNTEEAENTEVRRGWRLGGRGGGLMGVVFTPTSSSSTIVQEWKVAITSKLLMSDTGERCCSLMSPWLDLHAFNKTHRIDSCFLLQWVSLLLLHVFAIYSHVQWKCVTGGWNQPQKVDIRRKISTKNLLIWGGDGRWRWWRRFWAALVDHVHLN